MAETDVQLELKKRARRRLVGAAALALAAAIVLPMVMDESPPQSAGDLSIRIPGQEGGNVVVQPIAPPPLEPAAPASASPPVVSPSLEPVPAASEAPPAAAVPQPAAPAPSAPAASPARATPPAAATEASRAAAILAGRDPQPARTPSASARYFVQLGVYRDPDNVKSVQARAKTAGFKAVTEKVGSNTRVRVGPYASREAADAALAKLKKSGLNAVVAEAH